MTFGGLTALVGILWLFLFPPMSRDARHSLAFFVFGGAWMLAWCFYSLFVLPKRVAAGAPADLLDKEVFYKFTDGAVICEGTATLSTYAWAYWSAYSETDDYFILHRWPGSIQLIPKRALPSKDEQALLRDLLALKLPPKFFDL